MMFSPAISSPCNHLQSERIDVIREPWLVHGPMDSEQMFELLTERVPCWRSKLKADEGPSVLVKDSEVGGSIEVHAADLCGFPSVKERPPTWFSFNQGP